MTEDKNRFQPIHSSKYKQYPPKLRSAFPIDISILKERIYIAHMKIVCPGLPVMENSRKSW